MPKIVIKLDNESSSIIDSFIKEAYECGNGHIVSGFRSFIENEYKTMREIDQHVVVDAYARAATEELRKHTDSDSFYSAVSALAREAIANAVVNNADVNDAIDAYFAAVQKEYVLMPNGAHESIDFTPENRDKYIKNNLKLVVSCAKRYRGLGVPFEDLIQAGNIGLMNAFERYNPQNAKLRTGIISLIKESPNVSFTHEEAAEIVRQKVTYAKNGNNILELLPKEGFASKDDFTAWCHANIKTASFASVAFKWIRGAIMNELSYGRQVNIPYKELADGYTNMLRLDANPTRDNDDNSDSIMQWADDAFICDPGVNDNDDTIMLTEETDKLLSCLTTTERRIVKAKFGVGVPCALTIPQISKLERMPVKEVKKTIMGAMDKIRYNTPESDTKKIMGFLK